MAAAARGAAVWIEETGGRWVLHSAARAGPRRRADIRKVFAAALREQFGAVAGAIADREMGVSAGRQRYLSSRTIRRAVACAESASTMMLAQAALLQIECSGEMFGWRFVQRCTELLIDPHALSLEYRRAIDADMVQCFEARSPITPEEANQCLGELLQPTLH